MTEAAGGSGLGLSQGGKQIVGLQSASSVVDFQPGEGSVATFVAVMGEGDETFGSIVVESEKNDMENNLDHEVTLEEGIVNGFPNPVPARVKSQMPVLSKRTVEIDHNSLIINAGSLDAEVNDLDLRHNSLLSSVNDAQG